VRISSAVTRDLRFDRERTVEKGRPRWEVGMKETRRESISGWSIEESRKKADRWVNWGSALKARREEIEETTYVEKLADSLTD
jgi:hypothetical protein